MRLEAEGITEEDDIEKRRQKIKQHIKSAANEALGYRKINRNAGPKKNPWFNPEVKRLTREKREVYLQYLYTGSLTDHQAYKNTRNRTKTEIRKIKNSYWEAFTAGMEDDLYGAQKKIWKLLRQKEVILTSTYKHRQYLKKHG